jgi:hypothetical protein
LGYRRILADGAAALSAPPQEFIGPDTSIVRRLKAVLNMYPPNRSIAAIAGETLAPEQLKGLIRAGYVYRNGDEYLLTDMGREALAQPGVYPRVDAPPAPEAAN